MTTTIPQPSKRIQSIDILRGIVMVIMALDHTRDYFSNSPFEPTDLEHASTILFFTRWITHFCAPLFIFLSGVSAFLSQGKGVTTRQVSFRLFTRGLWLIFLEFTFIRLGWFFDLNYHLIVLQVIWAIGWSMIFLSVMVYLPRPVILTISLLMIFGHNLLDSVQISGSMGVLWQFLHVQSPVSYGDHSTVFIAYPLIPWLGVMSAGYCFGTIFKKDEQERNKLLYGIGISAIVVFIVLRYMNTYGDPSKWVPQHTWWRTVLSFINCTKYPPSLLYLLMTIGPGITLLPLFEKMTGSVGRFFKVYGHVPFFYYVLHLYLIHGMSVIAGIFNKTQAKSFVFTHPGFSLPVVYLFWICTILILYFPCRWFMKVKINNKQWWLSYL